MDKDNVTYNVSFAFRRGTYEDLTKLNEIPKQGEPIFELDTFKFKVGNGVKSYAELPYVNMDKIDAFLADADLTAAAVDTLKEIQEILKNSEFDMEELVKKIAEFETLHSELNTAIEEANKVIVEHNQTSEQIHDLLEKNITKVEKDFAAADQQIVEDANIKFDELDMDILVAKAEAVDEAKAYADERIENLDNALDTRLLKLEEIDHNAYINADQEVLEIVNAGDEKLSSDIATAVQEFMNADSVLETKIAAAESVAATALADEIARVEAAYAEADIKLSSDITDLTSKTLTDINNAKTELSAEDVKIRNEISVNAATTNNSIDTLRSEVIAADASATADRESIRNAFAAADDIISNKCAEENAALRKEFSEADAKIINTLNEEIARAKTAEAQSLADAKTYANDIKAELLGEGKINETYDTLKEISDWISQDGVDATELTNAIAAESTARQDQDAAIRSEFTSADSALETLLKNLLESGDTQLLAKINQVIVDYKAADEVIKNDLNSKDATLNARIDELYSKHDTDVVNINTNFVNTFEVMTGNIYTNVQGMINIAKEELNNYHAEVVLGWDADILAQAKAYTDEKLGVIENGTY